MALTRWPPKRPLPLSGNQTSSSIFIALTLVVALNILSISVGFAFFIDERQSPKQHEWNYARQTDWSHDHHECAGNAQSPINIQHRNVIVNNHLRLHFYNYDHLVRFKLQNAHHTIKMNPIESTGHLNVGTPESHKPRPLSLDVDDANSSLPDVFTASDEDIENEFETTREPRPLGRGQPGPSKGNVRGYGQQLNSHGQAGGNSNDVSPYNGAPTIKLDWLDDDNNEYRLRDIHFHWGERRDNGSEHAIEGKRAAMEMHLVHIKHGLEKAEIGYTSDSVAVIAVLVESYRRSNADFNPIVNALSRINMTDQAQEIEYKAIKDLLPSTTTNFYTYSGSLTTPPCYQVVNWIVLHDRLYLNAKQIEMFRNLYAPQSAGESDHESPNLIMPNIRMTQPLRNRTILASFSPYGRLEQIQIANHPMNGATSKCVMYQSLVLMVAMSASICMATGFQSMIW